MLRGVRLSEVATKTTKKLYNLPSFSCSGSDTVLELCQQPCHVENVEMALYLHGSSAVKSTTKREP